MRFEGVTILFAMIIQISFNFKLFWILGIVPYCPDTECCQSVTSF